MDHRGDLFFDLEHLELATHHGEHQAHASLDVERFEDLLLVADRRVLLRKVRGDEIGERARLANIVEDAGRLFGEVRHEAQDLARGFAQAGAERVELDVAAQTFADALDLAAHVGLEPSRRCDAKPAEPIEHHAVVALPEAYDLHDARQRPDS